MRVIRAESATIFVVGLALIQYTKTERVREIHGKTGYGVENLGVSMLITKINRRNQSAEDRLSAIHLCRKVKCNS